MINEERCFYLGKAHEIVKTFYMDPDRDLILEALMDSSRPEWLKRNKDEVDITFSRLEIRLLLASCRFHAEEPQGRFTTGEQIALSMLAERLRTARDGASLKPPEGVEL